MPLTLQKQKLIKQDKKIMSIMRNVIPPVEIPNPTNRLKDAGKTRRRLALNTGRAIQAKKPILVVVFDDLRYLSSHYVKKDVRKLWIGLGAGLAIGAVGIIAKKPFVYGVGAVLPLAGYISFSISLTRAGDTLKGTFKPQN